MHLIHKEVQWKCNILTWEWSDTWLAISNNPCLRLKHSGVRDGSDGADGTSYPLTENNTLPVALHTHLHYYAPGIRTIRPTHVLLSSQGLQLSCSRSHNAWRCLCLSSADSHIYLSAIAIYRMPHSPHICSALRFCHILQYGLGFRYLACRCISFAIIVFYRSEIYRLIFTLSSTMPSVLHILR